MKNKLFEFTKGQSGVTIGGGGERKPPALLFVMVIIIVMAGVIVVDAYNNILDGIPEGIPNNKNGFICTNCGFTYTFTRTELVPLVVPTLGPMMIDCPKCGEHTLCEARICPECNHIFSLEVENCPKCWTNYVKTMRANFEAGANNSVSKSTWN